MTIHIGAGGALANEWVSMLLRMYLRFCERHDLAVEVLDRYDLDTGGVASVWLSLPGEGAYGILRAEHGLHRLVRTPAGETNRHMAFASVKVLPDLGAAKAIEPRDVEIGRFYGDLLTSVRVRHVPTGTTLAVGLPRGDDARSHAVATRMLQASLAAKEHGILDDPPRAFGGQIRSYIFDPEPRVKDMRTGLETTSVQEVLDGALAPFIQAYLAMPTP